MRGAWRCTCVRGVWRCMCVRGVWCAEVGSIWSGLNGVMNNYVQGEVHV